jgi:predicted metalloenzyme YecM
MERYSELKAIVPSFGRIGHTALIGGREIMTVFLYVPIFFAGRAIHTLEIPAPKEGRVYREGYEHAEFVIKESFESFQERYPHLDFDTRALSKMINPDISLKLSDKISVKFHYSSLAYVVTYLES